MDRGLILNFIFADVPQSGRTDLRTGFGRYVVLHGKPGEATIGLVEGM